MKSLPKIIVIVGPTASGKTELGIKLAKKFGGEVVSADSRQIYKEMNIGTGKPEIPNSPSIKSGSRPIYLEWNREKWRDKFQIPKINGIRHYLLDVVNPDEDFTVALWKEKAIAAIKDILKRKKLPIIVGGTGLYIKALVFNLDIPQVPPDIKLRENLEFRIKNQGLEALYKELLKCDPSAKDVIDPKNSRRVIRALEVCLLTGKPFTSLQKQGQPLFDVLELGINVPRAALYKRIDRRVLEMYKSGLLKETKKLLKKYSPDLPAMSGIGYKETGEHLAGKISLEEAISKTQLRTHAYARRQLTWFRKDKKIKWIKIYKDAEKLINVFLTSDRKK